MGGVCPPSPESEPGASPSQRLAREDRGLRGGPTAGLCETCGHQQVVPNTRGSRFSLCIRSRTEPAYPRYPRQPVQSCPGYESRVSGEGGGLQLA